jgi:hypothetical protein
LFIQIQNKVFAVRAVGGEAALKIGGFGGFKLG